MNDTDHYSSWKCPCGRIIGWNDHENGVIRATSIKYAYSKRYAVPITEPPTDGIVDATKWAQPVHNQQMSLQFNF